MHYEKIQTNVKIITLNLKHKKGSCEKSKQKMSFKMGITFPLSQDLELGDKDLNNLLGERPKQRTQRNTQHLLNEL